MTLVLVLLCAALAGAILHLAETARRWLWRHWRWQRFPFSLTAKFPFICFANRVSSAVCSESRSDTSNDGSMLLKEDDLKELMHYIDESDGGPPWQLVMERSTSTLACQAWYRDPPFGPTQYRTRIIFRGISPEVARDFFWDDEFRPNWDEMLVHFRTLQVHHETGTMIVRWIRKLPLFCINREYAIVRRIWESESTYFCVTKGTTYPALPSDSDSRHVNHYYSSWYIREAPVAGDQQPGSEVVLFHHEDTSGLKGFVKMGIRAGLWRLIRRLDAGIQAYNRSRANGAAPSSSALLAHLTTKVPPSTMPVPRLDVKTETKKMPRKGKILKLLVLGGLLFASGISFLTIGDATRTYQHREDGQEMRRNQGIQTKIILKTIKQQTEHENLQTFYLYYHKADSQN